jgi:putative resolvase
MGGLDLSYTACELRARSKPVGPARSGKHPTRRVRAEICTSLRCCTEPMSERQDHRSRSHVRSEPASERAADDRRSEDAHGRSLREYREKVRSGGWLVRPELPDSQVNIAASLKWRIWKSANECNVGFFLGHVKEMDEWVSPKRASSTLGVCTKTLRSWADDGLISHKETARGQYRYRLHARESPGTCDGKERIIYARVSSSKQRGDLGRQIVFLRERFPAHRVVSDIGSGVNFGRKGLLAILDGCMQGTIAEVVVAHRDRLARIGYGIIEHVIRRSGCVLTIVEGNSSSGCTSELAEDVIAVLTHFAAKHHGRRAYKKRCDGDAKVSNLSNDAAEGGVSEDVRRQKILLEPGEAIHG